MCGIHCLHSWCTEADIGLFLPQSFLVPDKDSLPNWSDRGFRSGVDENMEELLAAQLEESYTVDAETDVTTAVWEAHMEEREDTTKAAVLKACLKTGKKLPADWSVAPHFRHHLRWADEQAAPFSRQQDGDQEEDDDEQQPASGAQQPAAASYQPRHKGGGGKGGGGKGKVGGRSWRQKPASNLRGSAARGRQHAVRSTSPHPSSLPGGAAAAAAASSQPPADEEEDMEKPTARKPAWPDPGQSSSASASALGQPPAVGPTTDQARDAAMKSSQPSSSSGTVPTPPAPPVRSQPASTPAEKPEPADTWKDWGAQTWQAGGRHDQGWQAAAGREEAAVEQPEQSTWSSAWSNWWSTPTDG